MKFQNIVARKAYTSNGAEKVVWLPVGTLKTTDEGKQFVELNLFPNTDLYVFDREPKSEKSEEVKGF